MRSDTATCVARLHRKDQKELTLAYYPEQLDAIERRLQPTTPVHAVTHALLTRDLGSKSGQPGVVLISSYGLHWEGRFESFDLGWHEMPSCKVASSWDDAGFAALATMPGYRKLVGSFQSRGLFVRLFDGTTLQFILTGNKPDSVQLLESAVAQLHAQHQPRY